MALAPIKRSPKLCGICKAPFISRLRHCRVKMTRPVPMTGYLTVFCSKECATEFARTIGGDPLLYDFGDRQTERRCHRCRSVLSDEHRFASCDVCRIAASIRDKLSRQARRAERLQKTIDAQRAFMRGAVVMETWD